MNFAWCLGRKDILIILLNEIVKEKKHPVYKKFNSVNCVTRTLDRCAPHRKDGLVHQPNQSKISGDAESFVDFFTYLRPR